MIAIGCDHGGYELKTTVKDYLSQQGITWRDVGCDSADSAADYPDYAKAVTDAILRGECEKGVLLCGTGIGVSIAANRVRGIRAALCHDVFSARQSRWHNDANVLAMGGRVIGTGAALEVLKAFLETEFSNDERHVRRLGKLKNMSNGELSVDFKEENQHGKL
ncbi:MAG: ribose 5-phosphate isomerase B [Clostridiales bacterium]|jgi:ribose 5-phosphate isomerase B|nr:ribose 5-phosphate isomerase B [Clostridiales bacterium]